MTAVVGWAPILAPWPDATLRAIEPLVPQAQFAAALRFLHWQDQQARLLARLILRKILQTQRIAKTLDDIALTKEGRPFLHGCGDFSIAHTTTVALCAWVPHGRIGLDVESSRPGLTVEDMLSWMSEAERRRIAASSAPLDEALLLWTAKEAVCKAEGCGIASGELPDCATPEVDFRGTSWRVHSKRRHGHTVSLARAAEDPLVWRSFRLRVDEQAIAALSR